MHHEEVLTNYQRLRCRDGINKYHMLVIGSRTAHIDAFID